MTIVKRLVLALMTAAVMATAATAQSGEEPNKKELEGSWKVTITPVGADVPPAFIALFTFTSNGGVVEADAGPPNPLLFSTGHGEWERIGKRQFAISYKQLGFDEPGNLIGILTARITATLNSQMDQLSGPALFDFIDPDGNVIFSGDATVQGSRIGVERLP